MSERDEATQQPCPECNGEVYRTFETGGLVSDTKSIHRRAGSEFNDRLKQIKKGSGRKNSIKHI
jgi:hypothetical protein